MTKSKSNRTLVFLLIAVIVIGLVVSSVALNSLIGNIRDFLGSLAAGGTTQSSSMVVEIVYTDGTKETFDSENPQQSIINPTTEKAISAITTKCFVTFYFKGEVSAWNVAGNVERLVSDANTGTGNTLKTFSDQPLRADKARDGALTGDPMHGIKKEVWKVVYTANEIEGWISYEDGRKYYIISKVTALKATLIFADGQELSKEVSGIEGVVAFKYQKTQTTANEFTLIIVNFNNFVG